MTMPRRLTARVPSPDASHVLDLCSRIVKGGTPHFVRVELRPDAELLDCFPTVERQVAEHGGEVCHGWRIWETGGVLVEGEFHAVWRTPAGDLVDVTPNQIDADRILFLPDPVRRYEGHQVNNIRLPLSDDDRVRHFIEAADEAFEFENRGDRAFQHGELRVTGADVDEWHRIQLRQGEAALALLGMAQLNEGAGPNDGVRVTNEQKVERNRRKRQRKEERNRRKRNRK